MGNCNCNNGCNQSFSRVRYEAQPPLKVARTVYHYVPQPPLRVVDTFEKVSTVVQNPCGSAAGDCGCGC